MRKDASEFQQELLDLYDSYVHGLIDRREFLARAGRFATAGVTAAGLLEMLSPRYAWAEQVSPQDPDLEAGYAEYASPQGHGEMRGYLVKPAKVEGSIPGVLVIHENRGLNPYIEDVARRTAKAGFLAFAPDALTPLGGYPENDDDGRAMQRKLDRDKITEDFVAAAKFLRAHRDCDGSIGVVGFCFGGGMANRLSILLPDIIRAAAPFYGRQPDASEVSRIKASLLLHYAELDRRVNEGWPAYEAALKEHGVDYVAHMYPAVNHGFHNDTTPRYNEAAAKLAWGRTIDFFRNHLGS